MAKQLSVSFKTVYKQCKTGAFKTSGHYDDNKVFITNVSEAIIGALKSTYDVAIDHSRRTITMMRNAQISLSLREYGYSQDITITFAGGQLMAVPW
ncbi:MAG: hypothetical protein U9Q12_02310 [Patescibacteria group bacterium]|nr:hypothetical protein [Patescibacteria group bacterium]